MVTFQRTFKTQVDRTKLFDAVSREFSDYPKWNPLIPSLQGQGNQTVEIGSKVSATVNTGLLRMAMKGEVTSLSPLRRFRMIVSNWHSRTSVEWLFEWHRSSSVTDVTLRVVHNLRAPIIGLLIEQTLFRFTMASVVDRCVQELRRYVEQPAPGAKAIPATDTQR